MYCVMIQIESCPVACMLCLVYLKYTTRLQSRSVSFSNIRGGTQKKTRFFHEQLIYLKKYKKFVSRLQVRSIG